MNKTIGKMMLLLLVSGLSQPVLALNIGDSLPSKGAAVKMMNVDGKEVSIATLPGEQGKLVVFSCNHCPYAKAWEKNIVEIGNTYSKKGIAVIMVNPNDPQVNPEDGFAEMQTRAKDKYQFPYVVDKGSVVADEFKAKKTPEAYLFDKNGKLVYHGAIGDDAKNLKTPYLANALDAVLAGKPIAKTDAEQPAVGCGIKFYKK